MRILFTVPGYKPAWRYGGPIVSVPALAEALTRRGHDVTVFTTNSNLDETLDVAPNRPLDVEGVRVWYFEKQEPLQRHFPRISYLARSSGILYSPRMSAALEDVAPSVDVVHTHLPFIYPTFAGARAAFRHGKPLFYHQRGVFDPARLRFRALKKRLYLRLIEMPIMRRANTLIALTHAERDSYRALGIDTPVRIIPNGIDEAAFKLERVDESLAPLGIEPEHAVVLFMGRIHPVKGVDKLVDAFVAIASSNPLARLVIAGPDEFGLEAGLKSRVASAGLFGRVIFVGMVTGELKHRLLARADLFCLPSDAEGFSMAIPEALAASTAVLISPGCHFDELATVGAGCVVEPDVRSLSDSLAALVSNLPRLKDMGRRGKDFVRGNYTWSNIAAEMESAYEEAMCRRLAT